MVTPIRAILKSAARAWGIEPAARLAAARAAWPRIAGRALAALSAPVGVRGRSLLIGVTNTAAAQEIRLTKTAIVQALARDLGEEAVTDVVPVARRRLDLRVRRPAPARRVSVAPSRPSKPARG
ncbi:MAG: DciA family protein [bacterium]